MEASVANSSGKGLFAPGIKCIFFIFGMRTMIGFPIAPFKTYSMQVVRYTRRHIFSIVLHHRRWSYFLDDVVEVNIGDTSLELLKAGEHIQVTHLGRLLLAVRTNRFEFCLGSKTLGRVIE